MPLVDCWWCVGRRETRSFELFLHAARIEQKLCNTSRNRDHAQKLRLLQG
jgi:hypothetical protein